MDLLESGLGDHAPADGRLVGDQDADEAGTAESFERLGSPGQEPDMSRVGKVMDVLDQGTVAVEEDGPAKCLLRFGVVPRRQDLGGVLSRPLQGFVSSDVQVIASPNPAAHPPDESGEDLEAEVERPHRGDLAIGLGVDHVQAGVGQVDGRLFGLLDERDDPSDRVELRRSRRRGDRARGTAPWSTDRRALRWKARSGRRSMSLKLSA